MPRLLDDPAVLRDLVAHLRDGLYVADADDVVLDANPAFARLVGAASPGDVIGRPLGTWLGDGTAGGDERTLTCADGSSRRVRVASHTRRGDDGRETRAGIVTELPAERAADAPSRDGLTGAFHHAYLEALGCGFDAGDPWGCVHLDLAGFGAFNARHGRTAGDAVLVRTVRFVMRHVRADEPVVRLANDEIAVLLRGATEQRTERVARRLQLSALRDAPMAFTLGWAVQTPGDGVHDLVARAAQGGVPVRVVERERDAREAGAEASEQVPA